MAKKTKEDKIEELKKELEEELTGKLKERTLEDNLKDPVYVNYNFLLKLQNMEEILLAILQVSKILPEKILREEQELGQQPPKEEREGVF